MAQSLALWRGIGRERMGEIIGGQSVDKSTDKRQIANNRTKTRIIKALLRLMGEKNFSDITVTDIVGRAKVARASYYRNFSSKEEVIASAGTMIFEDFRQKTVEAGVSILEYESVLRMFRYFRAYRQPLLTLHEAGFTTLYSRMFDECIESIAGIMPYDDIRRYCLRFYSGSAFSVFVYWLEEGMRETPEEMAELFYRMINGAVSTVVDPKGIRF